MEGNKRDRSLSTVVTEFTRLPVFNAMRMRLPIGWRREKAGHLGRRSTCWRQSKPKAHSDTCGNRPYCPRLAKGAYFTVHVQADQPSTPDRSSRFTTYFPSSIQSGTARCMVPGTAFS